MQVSWRSNYKQSPSLFILFIIPFLGGGSAQSVKANLGSYSPVINMPIVSVASAPLPNGKVLVWSAFKANDFDRTADRFVQSGGGSGKTKFAIFDPVNNQANLQEADTGHDMFCPSITQLESGDLLIAGGQNADKTSTYSPNGGFQASSTMNIARGYASSCILSNGKVFVLGGSFSGARVDKDAEIYDPSSKKWTLLPGVPATPIYTQDPQGRYRRDNYGWFFTWSDASVFHAGPSTQMHWITTSGSGSIIKAAVRPGGNSHNGHAVMFDTGKILTCGGSEAYSQPMCEFPGPVNCMYPARNEATVITLGGALEKPSVKTVGSMKKNRVYSNAVVLPDGKVLVTGGADLPIEFVDFHAHFQPEIFDPMTEQWTLLDAKHKVQRTYHSSAVLMTDGRVFTGGGGLCGNCRGLGQGINKLNAEIFSPPYLFNDDGSLATRPTILVNKGKAKNGNNLVVTSSSTISMVSMIRMGGATHSTNTDQRRLELCGPSSSPCGPSPIEVKINSDPGIASAGNWMIFGVNSAGVPSEAKILQIQL